MKIETKYDIDEIVFLMHDPDQLQRMIIGINCRPGNQHIYILACGAASSDHYEIEIAKEATFKLNQSTS